MRGAPADAPGSDYDAGVAGPVNDFELQNGRTFVLTAGRSYQVADNAEPHRSFTAAGAKLFIVD